ncbi:MAG: methyltransferase [Deltaproteobacteria bacterium]|nr:methyltransferase [Deltaproteobacteria bacterium]
MSDPPSSSDTLLHGRLALRQPARGHRVNLDAVLLAAFDATCRPRAPTPAPGPAFPVAADLGAGTGAVALLLRHAGVVGRCLLLEAEPTLAELARDNVAANRMTPALEVLCADLRSPLPAAWLARCDLVVANPPYRSLGTGKPSPDALRAAARYELRGGLPEFAAAAGALLRPDATFALICPWRRRAAALAALAGAGLAPRRERLHRPHAGTPPVTVCLEAVRGTSADPPVREELMLHAPGRRFSDAVERYNDGDYDDDVRSSASPIAPARTTR